MSKHLRGQVGTSLNNEKIPKWLRRQLAKEDAAIAAQVKNKRQQLKASSARKFRKSGQKWPTKPFTSKGKKES